jgi:hypothetical protein
MGLGVVVGSKSWSYVANYSFFISWFLHLLKGFNSLASEKTFNHALSIIHEVIILFLVAIRCFT